MSILTVAGGGNAAGSFSRQSHVIGLGYMYAIWSILNLREKYLFWNGKTTWLESRLRLLLLFYLLCSEFKVFVHRALLANFFTLWAFFFHPPRQCGITRWECQTATSTVQSKQAVACILSTTRSSGWLVKITVKIYALVFYAAFKQNKLVINSTIQLSVTKEEKKNESLLIAATLAEG